MAARHYREAWAAYDKVASGVFVKEKLSAANVTAARDEAMSYAAYRLLSSRYIKAVGGDESLSEFADVMDSLCYPLDVTTTTGDSPAALGNRIAETISVAGMTDGSNQAEGYAAKDYKPVNPPLVVAGTEIRMTDPNRWLDHERHPAGGRPAMGPRDLVRDPGRWHRGGPDRSGPAASFRDQGVPGPGCRGHPRQQPPRPGQHRADRHLPGRQGQ